MFTKPHQNVVLNINKFACHRFITYRILVHTALRNTPAQICKKAIKNINDKLLFGNKDCRIVILCIKNLVEAEDTVRNLYLTGFLGSQFDLAFGKSRGFNTKNQF